MSILMSLHWEQFPSKDEYGGLQGWDTSLHIANDGFSHDEVWIEMDEPGNTVGTLITVSQAKNIVEALTKFIKSYEFEESNKHLRCGKCGAYPEYCGCNGLAPYLQKGENEKND